MQRTRAGDIVLEEGSEGDTMLVIVNGRVRVEKKTLHRDSYTVSFLETGNFFGELALLDRDRRSATCVAESDCEFVVIHRSDFVAFGDRHAAAGLAITRRIASRLAERLLRANEDILSLFTALVQEVEGTLR
jgi:CRP-like cAMP-binding protein